MRFNTVIAAMMLLATVSCSEGQSHPDLLDTSAFEAEIDGHNVALYTIRGGDMTLQATNYGGRIASLFVPDRDRNLRDVVLGHPTLDEYVHYARERFLGACVGPVANRISGASFTIDAQRYELERNHDGKGTLHGGFRGLDSVVWDVPEVTDSSVLFHYVHRDGEGGFPGNLDIRMTYTLTCDNSLRIEYSAITDKTRPVNISNHPYFNFSESGTVEDYVMYVNADRMTGIDGLAVLEPTPVQGTAFDYRKPHALRDALESDDAQIVMGLGFDHNYCLNTAEEGLTHAASIYDPSSGISMDVMTDQPGLQVYSGQYFTGEEKGKRGTTLDYHGSITFETQNWPDAPNHPSFPDPYLRPGQTYHHVCVYRFMVK